MFNTNVVSDLMLTLWKQKIVAVLFCESIVPSFLGGNVPRTPRS